MRQDVQNRSVHAVATSVVFNRVADEGLPDSGPQKILKDCNVHQLVDINQLEFDVIQDRYRILVANILFEHFPAFAMFRKDLPTSTSCEFPREMANKSEVLTMPIMMKDEKKYSDCVDVLDQLEKWTQEIYTAAGLSSPEKESEEASPTVGTTSRPDQPASHVPPVASDSDPLNGVKIPCFGDQLTRVRFAGAKDLKSWLPFSKAKIGSSISFLYCRLAYKEKFFEGTVCLPFQIM